MVYLIKWLFKGYLITPRSYRRTFKVVLIAGHQCILFWEKWKKTKETEILNPERRVLITIILFFFIIPTLLADVIDIFFDTKYFDDLARKKIIDPRIHVRKSWFYSVNILPFDSIFFNSWKYHSILWPIFLSDNSFIQSCFTELNCLPSNSTERANYSTKSKSGTKPSTLV